jgi:hypothetical protein
MDLNNREWASLIWLVALAAFVLRDREVRSSVGQLVRQLFGWKLLVPILGLVAWSVAVVWVGAQVGLGNSQLIKDSVLWFGTALALLFGLGKSDKDRHYFRKSILRIFGISAVIVFALNVVVFPLVVELMLVPVLTFFTTLVVFVDLSDEHAELRGPLAWLNAVMGFVLVGFSIWWLARNLNSVDPGTEALRFALPLWMTLLAIPYIYVFVLAAAYESAFIRVDFTSAGMREKRRAKWALLSVAVLRRSTIIGLRPGWAVAVVAVETWSGARAAVRANRGQAA